MAAADDGWSAYAVVMHRMMIVDMAEMPAYSLLVAGLHIISATEFQI